MEFAKTAIWLESLAYHLSDWLDQHKAAVFAAISAVSLAATTASAKLMPFWFDELFTYYISQQPRLADVWAALATGIDQQPPMFYLLSRAASHLISDPHISLRLPSILGFWLLSVCVFFYMSRRSTALWGIVAVIILWLTPAYSYAYEARPYGLAAGFAAVALLAWQNAARGIWRRRSLVGLAIGIAAATSLSYYAVLIVAPLALAEIARSLWRRSLDLGVWAALACGSGVSFLYLPQVTRLVTNFSSRNWASPNMWSILDMFQKLLGMLLFASVAVLIVAAAGLIWPRVKAVRQDSAGDEPAPWEVVAAAALALLPFLGFAVAVLWTKMITFRYVLSAVIGFSILIALVLRRGTRSSALSGIVLMGVLAGCAAVGQGTAQSIYSARRRAETGGLRLLLSGQPEEIPVAVDDPLRCLELSHHEKPDITSRLVYLVDPEASLRYGTLPYPEAAHWLVMKRFMPIRAERMEEFRQREKRFLVYATGSPMSYVLPALAAEGAGIRLLAVRGTESLFLVSDHP